MTLARWWSRDTRGTIACGRRRSSAISGPMMRQLRLRWKPRRERANLTPRAALSPRDARQVGSQRAVWPSLPCRVVARGSLANPRRSRSVNCAGRRWRATNTLREAPFHLLSPRKKGASERRQLCVSLYLGKTVARVFELLLVIHLLGAWFTVQRCASGSRWVSWPPILRVGKLTRCPENRSREATKGWIFTPDRYNIHRRCPIIHLASIVRREKSPSSSPSRSFSTGDAAPHLRLTPPRYFSRGNIHRGKRHTYI